MRSITANVILFCDEEEGIHLFREQLTKMNRLSLTGIARNFEELISLLSQSAPDAVIIHLKKASEGYISYLKNTRSKNGNEFDVFICNKLPGETEITSLLAKIVKQAR